jgi:RNA polymerase sigma-70 factor (ECF subfamily)
MRKAWQRSRASTRVNFSFNATPGFGVLYDVGSPVGKVRLVAVPTPPDAASLRGRSDNELMALARAGLAPALRVLAERYMGKLIRFCGKFVVDAHVGQEIAQQTWLQLWTNRAHYESRDRFHVFLFTIARNLCRNELRRRARLGSWVDASATESRLAAISADPPQVDILLVRERNRELLHALAKVPEAQREAMLLRFDEELSYEEMAAVLGVSESTLRSRVYHGLRALRASMQRES